MSDTTYICLGDSLVITFDESKVSKKAVIHWETPYGSIYNSKQFCIKLKGQYFLKIRDENKTYIESTIVKTYDKPKINIRDTFFCQGSPVLITTKNKSYKYNWSTGETSDNIKIEKANNYWVKISNKGCAYTDTFKVTSHVGTIANFGKEILMCESDPFKTLSVKAPNDTKLFWNTGANSPSINVSKEGVYWVNSISKNCGSKTDTVTIKYKNCECDMYIPNSFTPNDDDKNDLFSIAFQCEYSYYLLVISDRWGNIVYSSNNINGKWDGKFKSNPCPDDIYVYHIEVIQKNNDKKITRNGKIALFR